MKYGVTNFMNVQLITCLMNGMDHIKIHNLKLNNAFKLKKYLNFIVLIYSTYLVFLYTISIYSPNQG